MIKKSLSLILSLSFVLAMGLFIKPVTVNAAPITTYNFSDYYNSDGTRSTSTSVLFPLIGDRLIANNRIYEVINDDSGLILQEYGSLQAALDYWVNTLNSFPEDYTYIGDVETTPPDTDPPATLTPISTGDDYYDRHYNYWITVYNQLILLPNNGRLTVDASGYNIDHVQHFVFDALNGTNRTLTFTFDDGTYVISGRNLGKIALGNNYTFVLLTGLGYCVEQL